MKILLSLGLALAAMPAAASAQTASNTLSLVQDLSVSAVSTSDLEKARVDAGKPFNGDHGGPGGNHGGHHGGNPGSHGGNNGNHGGHHPGYNPPPAPYHPPQPHHPPVVHPPYNPPHPHHPPVVINPYPHHHDTTPVVVGEMDGTTMLIVAGVIVALVLLAVLL